MPCAEDAPPPGVPVQCQYPQCPADTSAAFLRGEGLSLNSSTYCVLGSFNPPASSSLEWIQAGITPA